MGLGKNFFENLGPLAIYFRYISRYVVGLLGRGYQSVGSWVPVFLYHPAPDLITDYSGS